MNDVEGGMREKEEGRAQLLRKLASQVEGHAVKIGVSEEFVEVVGEELKDET